MSTAGTGTISALWYHRYLIRMLFRGRAESNILLRAAPCNRDTTLLLQRYGFIDHVKCSRLFLWSQFFIHILTSCNFLVCQNLCISLDLLIAFHPKRRLSPSPLMRFATIIDAILVCSSTQKWLQDKFPWTNCYRRCKHTKNGIRWKVSYTYLNFCE